VNFYEDRVSGKRGESGREAFKAMFATAARREWDCLLFWSLDRFSREGAFPTLRYLTTSVMGMTQFDCGIRSLTARF
jgi:DNA invertase Pin-like site-specific DNA recombinase